MRTADFDFDLPDDHIALRPAEPRDSARLLVVRNGGLEDRIIRDLPDFLRPGDALVFNDTRVIPARLLGIKRDTGGRVEVLVERVLDEHRVLAHVRASKSPGEGVTLWLEEVLEAVVEGREGDLFRLRVAGDESVLDLLERHGHMPLPPYIERADGPDDRTRYQTVFASRPGAVAAPTAGLHFDAAIMNRIQDRGVELVSVTLHVGAGTFQPVRVQELNEHVMHAEWAEVDQTVCDRVAACRARGGRVVAVGTTAVRSLESAASDGQLKPFSGDTRLFITPGYEFRVVDALVTNFHLPESTLLMLVSAFAGYEPVMQAYAHAVVGRYRFFSYGDAMFIAPRGKRQDARDKQAGDSPRIGHEV